MKNCGVVTILAAAGMALAAAPVAHAEPPIFNEGGSQEKGALVIHCEQYAALFGDESSGTLVFTPTASGDVRGGNRDFFDCVGF